jgi:hypothetical protein
MPRVASPITLGHQHLDRLAEQLLAGVPEEILRLGIEQQDFAEGIDHHHGVRGGLQCSAVCRVVCRIPSGVGRGLEPSLLGGVGMPYSFALP